MNTTHPMLPDTIRLASELKEKYDVPVMPLSVETMTEHDMIDILREALYEFPILEVKVKLPDWIAVLNPSHPVKQVYIHSIK